MSASDEMSDAAVAFVEAIEGYFGPWRGKATKDEIARWITSRGVERPILRRIYAHMRDTREVGPVNTISIVDVWDEIDHALDVASGPKQLEAPEYVKDEERAEVAQFLLDLSEAITDDTRRSELLRQREAK